MKRGIYRTDYGSSMDGRRYNEAYVSGPKAKTAFDLDLAIRIPIVCVSDRWIRAARPNDSPSFARPYMRGIAIYVPPYNTHD